MQTKVCNKCGKEKALDQYYKNSKGKFGKGQTCAKCSCKYIKDYRNENLPYIMGKKYNIPETFAKKMLDHKVCDICEETSDKMVIDHCHDTGEVRGRLCNRCNLGLGYFRHNTRFLSLATNYLHLEAEPDD